MTNDLRMWTCVFIASLSDMDLQFKKKSDLDLLTSFFKGSFALILGLH